MYDFGIHRFDDIDSPNFYSDVYRDVLVDFKINGRKFKFDGRLPFSDLKIKATYMTHFGPTMNVNGRCCYRKSVNNYEAMLMRIIGTREKEALKTINNRKISPNNSNRKLCRMLNHYFDTVKSKMQGALALLGDTLEEQILLATSPHVKQKLRVKSIKELIAKGEMLNSLFMSKISGKIKIPEFAKNGKKPRLIGDFTCPGSLLAGFLIPVIKHAFSESVMIGGSVLKFVYSTDKEELDSLFGEIDASPYDHYVFFSDDMCCKITVNGKTRWFNLDISSCDSSNGTAVFDRVVWFFNQNLEFERLLTKAVMQCSQRLVIFHPAGKKYNENITARPTTPIEFSGTQLTTSLNNIAASSICISLIYHLNIERTIRPECEIDIDEVVARAALAVGYEVTVDKCRSLVDVQFLKHSFYHDDTGVVRSFVNAGALLRSFGTCWMDLPFNSKLGESITTAAEMRNWQTLQGFRNSGLDLITKPLLQSPCAVRHAGHQQLLNRMSNESHYKTYLHEEKARLPVPTLHFMERYNLDASELEELVTLLSEAQVGHLLSCNAIDKIMNKDYGYPTRK